MENELLTAFELKLQNFGADIKNSNEAQLLELKNELNDLKAKGNDTSVLDGLKEQLNAFELKMNEKFTTHEVKSLADELTGVKSDLFEIAKGVSTKEIEIKANTVRANIANNTQSYDLPDIGTLAHRKLTTYDAFRKWTLQKGNDNGVIKYWDWDAATTVRAAAMVAEGGTFPESTAKFVEKTIALQKVGDTLPVSEEFFEDAEMFAAELTSFLDTNMLIKIDDQLINGNGTAPNIKGVLNSVDAYVPVAAGITDASIYDLLVKVSESITTTGGSKFAPDFAFMHISDINKMKLKKDANNNYIIPPFVSRDGNQVDTMIILENNALTPNTMVVGDRRYARIYEKAGLQFSKGHVGTQFVEDMLTLKVRKRLAFLIREADKGGFKKVTSISAALTTLAGTGV